MKLSRLQIRKLILESLSESFPQLFRDLPEDPDETEMGTRDLEQALRSPDFTDPQVGTVEYRPPVSFSRKGAAPLQHFEDLDILDPFSEEAEEMFPEREKTVSLKAADLMSTIDAEKEAESEFRRKYQKMIDDRQALLRKYMEDETAEETFNTDVLPTAEDNPAEAETEVEPTMPLPESLSRGSLIRRRWGRY